MGDHKVNAFSENFKTASGKDFGLGEVLDHEYLSLFITNKLGYDIVGDLQDNGRHVTAIIKNRASQIEYFFKVSTTEGIAERQSNEISFNEIIAKTCSRDPVLSSLVQPLNILKSGYYRDTLTYYIAEKLPLESFLNNIDLGLYPDILKKIASINIRLGSLTNVMTYKNELELKANGSLIQSVKDRAAHYYKVSETFASESGEDLRRLLELIKGYEQMDRLGLNHYDLKPDNISVSHENSGKIILTDGESASGRTPWSFDVAHLFHKLYTKSGSSDLAYLYLKEILALVSLQEREYFKFAFRTMLSSRLIGGFWEYSRGNDAWKNLTSSKNEYLFGKRLEEELLNDRLFDRV